MNKYLHTVASVGFLFTLLHLLGKVASYLVNELYQVTLVLCWTGIQIRKFYVGQVHKWIFVCMIFFGHLSSRI